MSHSNTTFKPGDLVICIKSKHPHHNCEEPELGKLYKVTDHFKNKLTNIIYIGGQTYSSECFVYPNLTRLEKLIYNIP